MAKLLLLLKMLLYGESPVTDRAQRHTCAHGLISGQGGGSSVAGVVCAEGRCSVGV